LIDELSSIESFFFETNTEKFSLRRVKKKICRQTPAGPPLTGTGRNERRRGGEVIKWFLYL